MKKNKLLGKIQIIVFGVFCCITITSQAGTPLSSTGSGTIGGNVENYEITPVVVTIEEKNYTTNINFYDYTSVVAGVAKLQADALANHAKAAGLLQDILNQVTALAKKMATHGRLLVKVEIDSIAYPTLQVVSDTADLNQSPQVFVPNSSSEMQTDNGALIQQLQQSASPK